MEERIEIEDLLFLALAKAWKGWVCVYEFDKDMIIVGFEWTHFSVVKFLPQSAWKYRHGLREDKDRQPSFADVDDSLRTKLLKMFSDNEAYEAVKHDMD